MGLDVDKLMVDGSEINLRYYVSEPWNLILGDAKNLPLRAVDCIATDPPYGRSASTKGWKLNLLLRRFLEEASSLLRKGGYLCLGAPSTVDLSSLGVDAGFKLVESHRMRVHKNLTRVVCVFKAV